MKAYLITTCVVFALVTVAHLARAPELMSRASSDPMEFAIMMLLTILSAGLALWAWRLLRGLPASSRSNAR